MTNPYDPAEIEITPQQWLEAQRQGRNYIVLDVREPWELNLAALPADGVLNLPMSLLAREGESALLQAGCARDGLFLTLCHHGVRSLNAAEWMRGLGWRKVFSLAGGIDAYARQIDSSVGRY